MRGLLRFAAGAAAAALVGSTAQAAGLAGVWMIMPDYQLGKPLTPPPATLAVGPPMSDSGRPSAAAADMSTAVSGTDPTTTEGSSVFFTKPTPSILWRTEVGMMLFESVGTRFSPLVARNVITHNSS